MKTLGEKIKELRRARDMTQEELAGCLSVTYQTVSKWETGVTSPDLSLIVPIARLFGVTTDELFDYSESADERKLAELQKRYDGTFRTGDLRDRRAVCEEAVKDFPGDMSWLNNLAWAIWCGAFALPDEEYRAERDRAAGLFRKVIENSQEEEIKANAILGITQCLKYVDIAEARKYAELYPKTKFDPNERRKLIISCTPDGEEKTELREKYRFGLFYELVSSFELEIKEERDACKALIELFLPDGNYLLLHYAYYRICLAEARDMIRSGDLDGASAAMKKAREHAERYDALEGPGVFFYTAPLFRHLRETPANWCKTGESTTLEAFFGLFEYPAYAPLKSHGDYAALVRR